MRKDMCIDMHIHMPIHVHAHTHVRVHRHACMRVCGVCMRVRAHVCEHACVPERACIRARTQARACARARAHMLAGTSTSNKTSTHAYLQLCNFSVRLDGVPPKNWAATASAGMEQPGENCVRRTCRYTIFDPRQRAGDKSDESLPPAHDAHGDSETLQPANLIIHRDFGGVTHAESRKSPGARN